MEITSIADHRGVFDRARAIAAGWNDEALRAMVGAGEIDRLFRGWYAASPAVDAWARHLQLSDALLRHFDGRAALSHYSAAVWHGLPIFNANPRTVHLVRVSDHSTRHRAAAVVHQLPARRDFVGAGLTVPGRARGDVPIRQWIVGQPPFLAVTPALSAVQSGLLGDPLAALMAADAALHRGIAQTGELNAAVQLYAGAAGIGHTRAILQHVDPRAESPNESHARWIVIGLGYRVVSQPTVFAEGWEYRADLALETHPVLIEVDGASKCASRQDLLDEKMREDRLRRRGWAIVRVLTPDINRPTIAHRVALAVREAEERRGTWPEVPWAAWSNRGVA